MRNSTKQLNTQLRKNPAGVIYFVGALAVLSLLFVIACLYKIYDSAYTTHLSCNKTENLCVIKKQDIIGNESIEYSFALKELKLVELAQQKNIFKQEVYYIALKDKNTRDKKYLLTGEAGTPSEQEEYLTQINNYLNDYYANEFELKNSRNKLKQIGFAAAGAGSLVAILLLFDCIKGIQDFKKKTKIGKYDNIIKPGNFL